jgi:hypothetical protein
MLIAHRTKAPPTAAVSAKPTEKKWCFASAVSIGSIRNASKSPQRTTVTCVNSAEHSTNSSVARWTKSVVVVRITTSLG